MESNAKVEVVLTPDAEPADADHAALRAMLPKLAEQYAAILGESVSVRVGPSQAERLLLAMAECNPFGDFAGEPGCTWCFMAPEDGHEEDCAHAMARRYLVARGLLPVTP